MMIVEGQLDRWLGRIGGVEELEDFDEFGAALDQRMDQRAHPGAIKEELTK